ncbi:hypothetical protein MYXA107069_35675 [Myxococcus xanthus]|nr:hypothetical protein MyxoNM_09500 [Myxococcus xanthus]SDY25811.1 hypothetical protein SAMN05444383_12821 [Myxococcus xanthus]
MARSKRMLLLSLCAWMSCFACGDSNSDELLERPYQLVGPFLFNTGLAMNIAGPSCLSR